MIHSIELNIYYMRNIGFHFKLKKKQYFQYLLITKHLK